jgi:hypothetical protein
MSIYKRSQFKCKSVLEIFSNTEEESLIFNNKNLNETECIKKSDNNEGWIYYPTIFCRLNPFEPINYNRIIAKDESFKEVKLFTGPWGELTKYGPMLSTDDEDILISLLHLVKVKNINYKETFVYEGSILKIARQITKAKRPGKCTYDRIYLSLQKLAATNINLKIGQHKKIIITNNIISEIIFNGQSNLIKVTINPKFYQLYVRREVTKICTDTRLLKIKGKIAKKMYLFVLSHKSNPVWRGHYMKLANALNVNKTQSSKQIKRLIKQAVRELIDLQILAPERSVFFTSKLIQLWRIES